MLRTNRYAHFLYLTIDVLLISLAFAVPYFLNPSLVPHELVIQKAYITVFIFWGICLIFILNSLHLYSTIRYLSIIEESFMVVKGVVFASVIADLFVYLLGMNFFSRTVFIEAVLALSIFIILWRILKRICVRKLISSGFANYNVLLIGIGKETELMLQEIKDNPFLGLRVKGILDDKRTGDFCEVKILGKVDDLEHIVKKYFIDEIYVTEYSSSMSINDFLAKCGKTGKAVRLIIDNFGLPFQKLNLNYLGSIPLITCFQGEQVKADSIIKRIFDIFVAGSILCLFLPVFIVIGLFIKIESSGPVFYISKRNGRKGIVFNFYKFRSMVHNADRLKEQIRHRSEVDGPIFKIRKDPRLTRVGAFLRKYSLDELPQLINVLKGDMSLVGPRPFPVEESEKIEYKHIPRLNIKPGITGLAQVKGRSSLKFSQWMRWDSWYVNNWSLGLDIKILLWTIPAVLKSKGAY
ncbi:MAG: sugar transferase [Candidatus Omnitrophica bacterium]|nr:sugar transferase [Candidatus Omnitrophota bacterium]